MSKNIESDLNMNGVSQVINLPTPINGGDAVNKTYVDSLVSASIIPEYTSDPGSPLAGQTWVLKNVVTGTPMGLLLSLTTNSTRYYHSYKTISGAIIRMELT